MAEPEKEYNSVFKEKTWGKEVDGHFTIDGYSFTGKKAFQKALDGLKDLMKKAVFGEVNGIKFKVLDARSNGTGLDIVIEMVAKGNRGVAVLKLYGPGTKKKTVVMVTKSKESDAKYVTMLAEEIIKPLIIKLLEDENCVQPSKNMAIKRNISVRGKEVKLVKCPITDDKVEKKKKAEEVDHIFDEAKKVVNLLLNDIIDLTGEKDDSIEEVDDITLDETCEGDLLDEPKQYNNKCENCEYVADAPRRYLVLKLLSKHKEKFCISKGKKCCKCDFEANEKMYMKRHMRDVHAIITVSTSPPLKKKRKSETETEPMDTSDVNDLKRLSFYFTQFYSIRLLPNSLYFQTNEKKHSF
jgi:hypothetical protein